MHFTALAENGGFLRNTFLFASLYYYLPYDNFAFFLQVKRSKQNEKQMLFIMHFDLKLLFP